MASLQWLFGLDLKGPFHWSWFSHHDYLVKLQTRLQMASLVLLLCLFWGHFWGVMEMLEGVGFSVCLNLFRSLLLFCTCEHYGWLIKQNWKHLMNYEFALLWNHGWNITFMAKLHIQKFTWTTTYFLNQKTKTLPKLSIYGTTFEVYRIPSLYIGFIGFLFFMFI